MIASAGHEGEPRPGAANRLEAEKPLTKSGGPRFDGDAQRFPRGGWVRDLPQDARPEAGGLQHFLQRARTEVREMARHIERKPVRAEARAIPAFDVGDL